jgi:hypothetical protein
MIYLDHNATTPILPEVLEAMMPYLTSEWGSRRAERRSAWASAAGPYRTDPACATESNNAAIAAALKANPGKRHIVTSQVEHSSVLNYCMGLSSGGFTAPPGSRSGEFTSPDGGVKPPLREATGAYRVTHLPVDRDGLLKVADLEATITVETRPGVRRHQECPPALLKCRINGRCRMGF